MEIYYVLHGGSHNNYPWNYYSNDRGWFRSVLRFNDLGFRLVLVESGLT
jgi:formylglycine-generating enzyme required for sulfatase activity